MYVHTGHVKEHGYLWGLYSKDKNLENNLAKRGELIKKKRNKLEMLAFIERAKSEEYKKTHRPLELTMWSKYIKNDGENLFSKDLSLQKYIDYYLDHYNDVKDDYVGVSDFSNSNANLPEIFLNEISTKLLENFDVKVTMVFRDPVRRLFSAAGRVSQLIGHRDPVNMIKKWVKGQIEVNANYSHLYKKWSGVFGKERVHMIVMEEFWAGKTQPLSDFLDFPIKKIHENVYYPDMGVNAPHYDHLVDQWRTDFVPLDYQLYRYLYKHMKFVYDDFRRTFGYIPESWKK